MRSRAGSYTSGGEDGFTLVELLLAIVIIGVITAPLANVVIGYFHNTDTTTERLLRSHDVQIASAYWQQDVASIGHRDAQVLQPSIQPPAMTPESHCTSTGTIATFTWDEFADATGPATVVTVAYRVAYDSESKQCELHRDRSTSPATDVVLVHHLNPATLPTVTCYPANSTSATDCTTVPTANEVVKLNLSLTDPGSQHPGSPAGIWDVTLSGQRRGSS